MVTGAAGPKLGLMPSYRSPAVATPEYAAGFAVVAEESGCESVWACEHVVIPVEYASGYPYAPDGRMPLTGEHPIPDPLDWLAFVAGRTERLRLGTAVLILPEHNPVEMAKRLATIDTLSGGRLMLGIGVGWMREEADAVGTDFDQRGPRTDEYVDAMRALWTQKEASFDGPTVHFQRVRSEPKPAQSGGVPIHVGGHSKAAARRAGQRGDGFYPLGVDADALPALLKTMRAAATEAGRDPDGIELTVTAPRDADTAKQLIDLGASRFVLSARDNPDPRSVSELVERFRQRTGT